MKKPHCFFQSDRGSLWFGVGMEGRAYFMCQCLGGESRATNQATVWGHVGKGLVRWGGLDRERRFI